MLPFTTMADVPTEVPVDHDKRKTYSLDFKRRVVRSLSEKHGGNVSATAREFDVSRCNVIRWRGQADMLEKANKNRLLSTRSRRRFRVGKSAYPLLDKSVCDMIKDRRSDNKCVTMKRIKRYAREVFPDLYPELLAEGKTFRASDGWLRRFMKRNHVVNRNANSVGQKVPGDAPDRCDMFLDHMKNLPPYEQYFNMDETPCYFDVPRSTTCDFRGVQTVKIKTTGYEKLRFTAALTAGVQRTSDGGYKAIKLSPLLIFKNLKKPPKGKFPSGMVVLGSKGGTMHTNFMINSYIPQIYKRRPGNFFNSPESIFIMDNATCHRSEDIVTKFRSANTDVKYIESGMTPLLQFLDTHINKPFKDSLKDQWEEWLDNGKEEFTKTGKRKRASYEMVAEWVHNAWEEVAMDEIIVRGFRENGYMGWSGKTTELHSKLRETVEARTVPREIVEEVDRFLDEMRKMEDEEITTVQDGNESADEDEETGVDIEEELESYGANAVSIDGESKDVDIINSDTDEADKSTDAEDDSDEDERESENEMGDKSEYEISSDDDTAVKNKHNPVLCVKTTVG